MQTRAVTLLRAASAIVGGDRALAQRLGIGDALLSSLLDGQHYLPDSVLLGTVDIILAHHDSRFARPNRSPAPAGERVRFG
jgi:hypothetical protein